MRTFSLAADRMHFPKRHPQRFGVTWIQVLVVLAILVVVIASMMPASRRVSPRTGRRIMCQNNLLQIGQALHEYAETHGAYPPAYTVDDEGHPLHSWRTLILPFLDQQALYESIDLSKPWDDPANAEVFATRLEIYQCPSVNDMKPNQTTYLAIVGEESAFHPARARALTELDASKSTAAMVVEVAVSDAVAWMEPRDTNSGFLSTWSEDPAVESGHGTLVLCTDTIRLISHDTTIEEREALATLGGVD